MNHTGSSTAPYNTEAKATRNIQTALNYAATDSTIWIKADQDYVMNRTDQQASSFNWGLAGRLRIKGYYLTTGDQDYGGTYYKDAIHGWVVVNANNRHFHVFANTTDLMDRVWENFHIINVLSTKNSFYFSPTTAQDYYIIRNCWLTGGNYGIYIEKAINVFIEDCKFTGTYTTDALYLGTTVVGLKIFDCEFAHGDADNSIRFTGSAQTGGGAVITGNTFNPSGTVETCIYVYGASWISNNTIYGSGGTVTYGIYSFQVHNDVIQNNIIVGCTTGEDGSAATLGYVGGWNCFYNNGTNWTIPERPGNDIVADPQFMDAANGDFRLKPTSPCLNTGKPTRGGGFTDIGAWQGKSMGFRGDVPANCVVLLEMDFNNDCKVDFKDMAIFAQSWLECNLDPPDGC